MMDDEGDPLDDDMVRAMACELTQWFYDNSPFHPATIAEFIATAQLVEHYVTNGGSVEFKCQDGSRKFVQGGI